MTPGLRDPRDIYKSDTTNRGSTSLYPTILLSIKYFYFTINIVLIMLFLRNIIAENGPRANRSWEPLSFTGSNLVSTSIRRKTKTDFYAFNFFILDHSIHLL